LVDSKCMGYHRLWVISGLTVVDILFKEIKLFNKHAIIIHLFLYSWS
jgi:hypothetical protein